MFIDIGMKFLHKDSNSTPQTR